MKKIHFIFLFLLFVTINAQETKKVKVKNKKSNIVEEFDVYKMDNSIKCGEYKKFYNSKLIEEGFYRDNKKDSVWIEYSKYINNNIKSKGYYNRDVKVGIWEFYNFKGEIEQKYNYSTNELLYNQTQTNNDTNKLYKVIIGTDTINSKLDRVAVFIGGTSKILETFVMNLNYPSEVKESYIAGKVLISFIIDVNGKTKNHKILNGIGYGCDEEALRVVKNYLTEWAPAKLKDQNVEIEYTIPVSFKMN